MKINTTKEEMEDLYIIKGLGSIEISKRFNVSPSYIRKILRNFNIPIKKSGASVKYIANNNFFSTWSKNMAYCLGFISADGHVWKDRPFLTIGINKRDYDTLKFIVDNISPSSKIRSYDDMIQVNIHSEQIHKDLNNLGIKNNKTFNLKIDFDIPEEYWGDYLRGVFDGDGSIWKTKFRKNSPDYYYANIASASYQYLKDIQDKLGFGIIKTVRKKYYEIKFCQSECLLLFDIIYKNPCYKMERKYLKFLKISPYAKKWTNKEIEILIKYNENKLKLIELLPGRSWQSIKTKKNRINK